MFYAAILSIKTLILLQKSFLRSTLRIYNSILIKYLTVFIIFTMM